MQAVPGPPWDAAVPSSSRGWRGGEGAGGGPYGNRVFLLALVSQTSGDSQSEGNTHACTRTHLQSTFVLTLGLEVKPNKDSYSLTRRESEGLGYHREKEIEWAARRTILLWPRKKI